MHVRVDSCILHMYSTPALEVMETNLLNELFLDIINARIYARCRGFK